MSWLQRFMMGRYGSDQLGMALLVFSVILLLIGQFVPFVAWFALLPLFLCWFRILSRSTAKRYAENQKFLQVWHPVKQWFATRWKLLAGNKTHKFYRCPSCKQMLRVPRGRGKITITCPKCSRKFTKKT